MILPAEGVHDSQPAARKSLLRVRPFAASVSYRDSAGQWQEESFPLNALDPSAASHLAFLYVRQVLRLEDFELRIVGA